MNGRRTTSGPRTAGTGATPVNKSFSDAAAPEQAEPLYDRFCAMLAGEGVTVARGAFGARMRVELVNDGPVTIVLG